jgi:nucleolar protein 15
VARIAADTMNGYMLMGKILVSNTLSPTHQNPFTFATSKRFHFINWKRIFMHQINKKRTGEEMAKEVAGLLRNEKEKKINLKNKGINYDYPGFEACLDTLPV